MEPRFSPADSGSRAVTPQHTLAILAGAAALAALLVSCGDASGPEVPSEVAAARTITEADMRRWIALLSDDSMAGRATPSAELNVAAAAIADRFARLGLRPAFGASFVQSYLPAGDLRPSPNVAGVLEGADPARRGEYVVLVAHMDHLGVAGRPGSMCQAQGADSICNGADDNASGTAGVLELA